MTNLKEYSKKIVQQMIEVWFTGFKFGVCIVGAEVIVATIQSFMPNCSMSITVHLPELLAYVGAPVSSGILGYLLKAAFENREKIKIFRNKEVAHDEYSDTSSDRQDLGQSRETDLHGI